jgi:hypothetical protein
MDIYEVEVSKSGEYPLLLPYGLLFFSKNLILSRNVKSCLKVAAFFCQFELSSMGNTPL